MPGDGPDLARMAGNPLLLTVMALVHARESELPEARALLYDKCVDVLLWLWERRKETADHPTDLLRIYQRYLETGSERDRRRLLRRSHLPPDRRRHRVWQ